MNDTLQLKREIMAILDLLPLEGLKLYGKLWPYSTFYL